MRGSRSLARWPAILSLLALVVGALACGPLGPSGEPSEGDDQGGGAGSDRACAVPDVAGLDQVAAQRQLVNMGLMPIRMDEPSESVAVDLVISINPPAGTVFDPCEATVTIVVSSGRAAAEVPPTVTPTAQPPLAEGPGEADMPMFFWTAYEETFETRFGGFRPEWSVDALPENSRTSDSGELVTEGYVAAFIGDSSWFNYRVTLGGGDYSGVEDLQLLIRTQDNQNFVGMACFPSEGYLVCEGRRVIDGQEGPAQGFQQTTRFCAAGQIQCDITFEAMGDQFRVLVNGQQVAGFTDSSFSQGGVGIVVRGKWVLDYFEVVDPGGPAAAGYTLFRDDFDTDAWSTGSFDDEYASVTQEIVDGTYRWNATAKRGVVFKEIHEIYRSFELEEFPYRFSFSAVARVTDSPGDAAFGLLFRSRDAENHYYFQVSERNEAALYVSEDGEWTALVEPTPISALRYRDQNSLRVVAEGTRFSFWINGEGIFEATDDRIALGNIGLALELQEVGDRMTIEFDDVRIGLPHLGSP